MPAAEAFLKTIGPMRLKDAPGGAEYLTTEASVLDRGKTVFAEQCARCHSSKQPPAGDCQVDRRARAAVVSRRRSPRGLPRHELPVRRPAIPGDGDRRPTWRGRWRQTRSPDTSGRSSRPRRTRSCRPRESCEICTDPLDPGLPADVKSCRPAVEATTERPLW